MFGTWQSHAQFRQRLKLEMHLHAVARPAAVRRYADVLARVWLLDLDRARPVLEPAYPPDGRPCERQAEILRALVVMTLCREGSITRFVMRLRAEPVLATCCGFVQPEDVPGVGTFYDFQHRLWSQHPGARCRRSLRRRDAPSKKGQKLTPRRPGVVKRLAEQAAKGRTLTRRPERLLQTLLAAVAVRPSAARGLLGDLSRLAIAGDGAPLETGAAPYGQKTCRCEARRCRCPRRYSDPQATWGWDSYHERWFYGHTLYHITAADSSHDLPLLVRLVEGRRHDSVTAVVALAELRTLYPDWTVGRLLADAAHDATAFYQLSYGWRIQPFIDANKRRQGQYQHAPPKGTAASGAPVCAAGEEMIRDGFDRRRCRIKWRCPRTVLVGSSQPCACSPSAYGRVIHTYPAEHPRTPPVPRDTKRWKAVYKRRTSVERSLKRTLVDYDIEAAGVRGKCRWSWRATLAPIAQHLDAWVAQDQLDGWRLIQRWEHGA